MDVHLPTLGDVPRLRSDVQISSFQHSGSASKFLVQSGPSCFVVNSEMRDLLEAMQERPGTFPEFADKVSARTGKIVSVETLRAVLGRLSPALFEGQAEYKIQTPFIFNVQIISANMLRRVTRSLTWLFAWPVAAVLLLAFFGFEYWFFHAKDLRMIPGQTYWIRFVLIYGGVMLGGLIHEVGHLTACARHKAEHGGIGLGLYLIFPAFYADVTNAWRLPKRARIAVDLGGLYFQALFLLATGIIALKTHNMAFYQLNFFTLTIMVLTLNPALKFDGYWLLVDASGIHNLYPRMNAMLKGIFGKKNQDAAPAASEETKVFVALYAVLVVTFSVLLTLLVTVSIYRTSIGYPARLAATGHTIVQAFATSGSAKEAFKSVASLFVDSFWILIVATFVFNLARNTVRLFARA